MDVVVWLRGLGLGKYEAAFRENEIDGTVLPSLTEEHLKQLGVTALGHWVNCWMLSPLCGATLTARRPRLTQGPRRAPEAHIQKTAPNVVR